MGLKKRNKVSAEFSMSSLTDIIFLLLIFFMLTSTLANTPPFTLPSSDSKTVAPTSVNVAIRTDGTYILDNVEINDRALEKVLRQKIRNMENQEGVTITIVAEVGTSFDQVVKVMKVAGKLKVRAIIATQPKT
ncbi:MAG: biopolymer transporter ExbD [Bacteroidetes bacterium]|nr:MAG: biopolymer transporter ExbD [Bacteroidota bacterium]